MRVEDLMKKRWGVRVVAILMVIAGLLLFLLGFLPAVRSAVQGAGTDLGAWLAISSALCGCAGALFLLVAGTVLLTVGKIAENFAAANQPAPAVVAKVTAPAVDRPLPPPAAALPAAPALPGTETVAAPAAGMAIAALAAEEHPDAEAAPAAGIIEDAGTPALIEETALEETAPPAEPGFVVFEKPAGEEIGAPEDVAPAAEPEVLSPAAVQPAALSPQEEVGALQVQLAALQAQLDQMEGVAPASEELPAVVEDEGPAPGAAEEPRLPGADDAARVAAEMAALKFEPEVDVP
jgi:hypothetical protein